MYIHTIHQTIAKPTFDIKGRYKWDAWTKLKGKLLSSRFGGLKGGKYLRVFLISGTSQEDAEKQYIALVESLKAAQ